MSTVWVAIPEEEWSALTAFVASQGALPFGIEVSVQTAKAAEGWRIVGFTSAAAVNALIRRINDYAQTWAGAAQSHSATPVRRGRPGALTSRRGAQPPRRVASSPSSVASRSDTSA